MRTQTSLGWIAGLVLTTTAIASSLLMERVNGAAILNLKSGDTAYASIDIVRSGEKFGGDIYFQKEASKIQEAIQFQANSISTFKIAPGMAHLEGVGLIGNGKWPTNKTRFSLTVLDFSGSPSVDAIAPEADVFVLTVFDAKNNAIQFNGWVVKGDFFVTITDP